jgi:phosphonate transport system substrate-binding protein
MKRRNFLWYSLLLMAGCTTVTSTRTAQSTANLPKKLRLTVTDTNSLEELQQNFEPFRAALEEVLETPIEFFLVKELVAAAPAMLAGQIDLAWAGPSEYVLLNARSQAIPVVAVNRLDYRTVVVTPTNSPLKSLSDLQGKILEVGEIGGTAAHLGAVELLLDAKIDPSQVKVTAATSEDDTLARLKRGEMDAISRSLPGYRRQVKDEGFSESEFRVLAQGPLLPGDVFAISSQLGTEVAKTIRSRMLQQEKKLMQAITSVEALEKFVGSTFSAANDTDYEMIREAYRAIGQAEVIQ